MNSDKTLIFKYRINPAILGIIILVITGIAFSLIETDNLLVLFIFTGIVCFIFLSVYLLKRPKYVFLNEQTIRAPKHAFFPSSSIEIDFKDIKKIDGIGLELEKCIKIYSHNNKLNIYVEEIHPDQLQIFLDVFADRLTPFFKHKPIFSNERDWLEKKRTAEKPSITFLLFVSLTFILQNTALNQYYLRQIQLEVFLFFSLSISLLICLFSPILLKSTHAKRSQGVLVLFCLMSSFCISCVFSFFNQHNDYSKEEVRIASLLRYEEDNSIKDDECYSINSELLKENPAFLVCKKLNAAIDETSIVEVKLKQGNLGGRWLTSAELLDKKGKSKVIFTE